MTHQAGEPETGGEKMLLKISVSCRRLPIKSTLAGYMFAACACSAVGAVVLRVIMYGVGTSVEQFIYH